MLNTLQSFNFRRTLTLNRFVNELTFRYDRIGFLSSVSSVVIHLLLASSESSHIVERFPTLDEVRRTESAVMADWLSGEPVLPTVF